MKLLFFAMIGCLIFFGYIYYVIRRDQKLMDFEEAINKLSVRIKSCKVNIQNEIYLLGEIDHIKTLPMRDKERIDVLECEFRRKYQVLHEVKEHIFC